MRLTLLRAQMKELLNMSLLIDLALGKMPKENKEKESTNTNENNEMKNRDETIHETRKKTMDKLGRSCAKLRLNWASMLSLLQNKKLRWSSI